jgi:hypothetical protein
MFDKNHLRKGPVTDAAIVTQTFVAILYTDQAFGSQSSPIFYI